MLRRLHLLTGINSKYQCQ